MAEPREATEDGAWVRRRDPSSGRFFYFDLESHRSTYDAPAKVLHGDWEVMKDPGTDRLFYFHKKKGTSQWGKPKDAFVDPEIAFVNDDDHEDDRDSDAAEFEGSMGEPDKDSWIEAWDEQTHRKFWYQESTGQSRWVRPGPEARLQSDVVAARDLVQEGRSRGTTTGSILEEEGDWRMMKDNVTGRVFFYNVESGHSQWERPEAFDGPSLLAGKLYSPAERWERLHDPATGRVFFFNREEGIAQWERPHDLDIADGSSRLHSSSASSSPTAAEALRDVSNLAVNASEDDHDHDSAAWEELFDPDTNRAYYFNRKTGRSSWTLPSRDHKDDEDAPKPPVDPPPPQDLPSTAKPPAGEIRGDQVWKGDAEDATDEADRASGEEAGTATLKSTYVRAPRRTSGPPSRLAASLSNSSSLISSLPPSPAQSLESPSGSPQRSAFHSDEESSPSLRTDEARGGGPEIDDDVVDNDEDDSEDHASTPVSSGPVSRASSPVETEDAAVRVPAQAPASAADIDETQEDGRSEASASGGPAPSRASSSRSLSDWQELEDETTGRTYFFNQVTGESQWIDPRKTTLVDEDWCELEDADTHRKYFYNKKTGESRWRLADIPAKKNGEHSASLASQDLAASAAGSPDRRLDRSTAETAQDRVKDPAPRASAAPSLSTPPKTPGRAPEFFDSSSRPERTESLPTESPREQGAAQSPARRSSAHPGLPSPQHSPGGNHDDVVESAAKLRDVDSSMFDSQRRLDRSETADNPTAKAEGSSTQHRRRTSAMPRLANGGREMADSHPGDDDTSSSSEHHGEAYLYGPNRRLDRSATLEPAQSGATESSAKRRTSAMPRIGSMARQNGSSPEPRAPAGSEDGATDDGQPGVAQAQLREVDPSMFDPARRLERSETLNEAAREPSPQDQQRRTSAIPALAGGYLGVQAREAEDDGSVSDRGDSPSRLEGMTMPALGDSISPENTAPKPRRSSAMPDLNVGQPSVPGGGHVSDGAAPGLMANYLNGFRSSSDEPSANGNGQRRPSVMSSRTSRSESDGSSSAVTGRGAGQSRRKSSLLSFSPFIGSIAEEGAFDGDFVDGDDDDGVDENSMMPPLHPPPSQKPEPRRASTIPDEFRPDLVFGSAETLLSRAKGSSDVTEAAGKTASRSNGAGHGEHDHVGHLPGPYLSGGAGGENAFEIPAVRSAASPSGGATPSHEQNGGSAAARMLAPLRGYLEKRARHGRQQWQKRYFMLDDRCLRYFESERQATTKTREQSQLALARIDMAKVSHVEAEDGDEGFLFGVYGRGALGVLVLLRAASAHERDVWVAALGHRVVKEQPTASRAQTPQGATGAGRDRPVYGRCVESVASSEPGMLELMQGDTVRVLQMSDQERWWVGEANGRVGNFRPESIVLLGQHDVADDQSDHGSQASSGVHSGSRQGGRARTDSNGGLRTEFNRVERRIEARKRRSDLESLLAALGVEPMKPPEDYPTETYLRHMQEQLKDINVRNHKLLAEVRSLEWKLEHEDVGPAAPNAYLLVSYSKLLSFLRTNPRVLVQIGANLAEHDQAAFAGIVADALFDEYSVDEAAFEAVLEVAVEMLWDQGLPLLENMRRRDANLDTNEALLPSLLASFLRRAESRRYLDRVLASVKEDFTRALLEAGETRAKVVELACLLLDVVASEAGLDLVPQPLCNVGAMLFDIGGQSTLYRFFFESVLVPALFWPGFLPDEASLGDPALFRRMRTRIDGLVGLMCVELVQEQQTSAEPPSNARRLLLRLAAKLTRKIVDDAGASAARKPAELSDLIVVACEDLYQMRAAADHWTTRFRAPGPLLEALEELGDPAEIPAAAPGAQPYLVIRVQPTAGGLPDKDEATPLDRDTLRLLIKARSKVDSSHDSWSPRRDGELLEQLETRFEDAKQALDCQRRIRFGAEVAGQYLTKLQQTRQQLAHKLESRRHLSTYLSAGSGLPASQFRSAGLVASLASQSPAMSAASPLQLADMPPPRPTRQAPPVHRASFSLDEVDSVGAEGFGSEVDLPEHYYAKGRDLGDNEAYGDEDDESLTLESVYGRSRDGGPSDEAAPSDHLGDLLSTVFSPFNL